MPGYQQLTIGERVRVDAHILDHFRDNRDNYTNEFRLMVREQARLAFGMKYANLANPPASVPESMYEQAFRDVLGDVRDVMALRVGNLPSVKSENLSLDAQLLKNTMRLLGNAMVENLEVNPVTVDPSYNLSDFINHELALIQRQTGSNLRISGNTSDVPRGYLLRAKELQRGNLMSEYSPSVQAAVARLQTPLSDRLEAEAIRVAVNELNSPNLLEKVMGNNHSETREEVGHYLRARGVYLRDAEGTIDGIVSEAVPIARGGKIDDPGGNRGK